MTWGEVTSLCGSDFSHPRNEKADLSVAPKLGSLRHLDVLWASIQDLLSQRLRDLAIRMSGKLPSFKNVNDLHGYLQPQAFSHSHTRSPPVALSGTREGECSGAEHPGLHVWDKKTGLPTEWQCGTAALGGQNWQREASREEAGGVRSSDQ